MLCANPVAVIWSLPDVGTGVYLTENVCTIM
jgi:hypothetical protein